MSLSSDSIPGTAHAIIIGAMKCGTSSLYDYLCGHPQICPCRVKEPEYFSENQAHGLKVGEYRELFQFDHTVHKWAPEASTGYAKYPTEPNVAKNIYSYGLSPKFIYIIRNPYERIESQFNFWNVNHDRAKSIVDPSLLCLSDYYMQLERYAQYFSRDGILILDFDDLVATPSLVLSRVYEHLDLSVSYFPEAYDVSNKTSHPKSHVERAIEQLANFCRVRTSLPALPKQLLRKAVRRVFPGRRRRLTRGEAQYVHDQLLEGMCRLHEVYGVNVEKWGFNC